MKKSFLLLVISFTLFLLASCDSSDPVTTPNPSPEAPLAVEQLTSFEGVAIPDAFNFHNKLDTEFKSINYYQPTNIYAVKYYLPKNLSERFSQFDFSSLAYNYKYNDAYIIRCDLFKTTEDVYNVQYFFSKEPVSVEDVNKDYHNAHNNPFHHKNTLVINIRNAFECAYPYINGKGEYMENSNKVYVENLGEHTDLLPCPEMELKSPKDFSPSLYHAISAKTAIQRPRSIMYEKSNKRYGLAVTSFISNVIEISYNGLFYSFQYWSEKDDDKNFHLEMRKIAKEFVLGSN